MLKIILCDVDDVLANLVPTWLNIYNGLYGEELKPEDITEWNIQKFARNDIYWVLRDKTLYSKVPVIKDALNGIKFLRSYGHRVIFVTSSLPENSWSKYYWLNRNGFDVLEKDYFEAKDKSVFNVDYIIDDNYGNVSGQERRGAKGIIFTKAWNKIYKMQYRVDGWRELMTKWRIWFEYG